MANRVPRNEHSVEIKRILRVAVAKRQAKAVAVDCEVVPSALTHWTSDLDDSCLPVDVLPVFMASTGDIAILHYLAAQAGMRLVPIEEVA